MDMNWPSYFQPFWIFPLLCVLFMAVMMLVCRGTHFRGGSAAGSHCCGGEAAKKQDEAGQRIA